MLKRLIKYTDYDGRERSENFYFYLSKAELVEMEMSKVGGMQKLIQLMIEKQDIPQIMKNMKMVIMKSYGEKSPDGRRFIKSEALSEAFSQTEAYSQLYVELVTNAEAAANFINAIVPEDVAEYAEARRKAGEEAEKAETEKGKELAPNVYEVPANETEKKPEEDGTVHLLG